MKNKFWLLVLVFSLVFLITGCLSKNNNNYQEKWNEILSQHVPSNLSLAKEISELLDVSLDSAYRRLRNDTEYTLTEAAMIADMYEIEGTTDDDIAEFLRGTNKI